MKLLQFFALSFGILFLLSLNLSCLLRRLSPERVHDGPVAVLGDGDEGEDRRVDGDVLGGQFN